jgi:uncharacterized protein YbaP (TraB family)
MKKLNTEILRNSKHYLCVIILTTLYYFNGAGVVNAQQINAKPGIFYAITGNGLKDTSYLFGTYHLIKSDYLKTTPHVENALHKSKGVVVEVVIDSTKLPQFQSISLLKEGTLSSLLSKTFADSLNTEIKATLGADISQVNQLKPVTISLTLSMVYIMKNNAARINQYGGMPLDLYFASYGKKQAKQVTPLETLDEQMDILFNKASIAEQVDALKLMISEKKEMMQYGDQLLQGWFDNDLDKMEQLLTKYARFSENNDYLLKDRNLLWMKKLPELMKAEPQFVAVGALHLAGKDGLVALLRGSGFTVTPINL